MSNIIKRMDKNYLHTGEHYWTFSPVVMRTNGIANVGFVYSACYVNYHYVDYTLGVRPVVSLISGTLVETNGDGTSTNPYVVK